jgi:hypothetical protein
MLTDNLLFDGFNVIMKNAIYFKAVIDKNGPEMGGVFTTSDLANLLGTSEKSLLPKRIQALEALGIIKSFARGFYVVPNHFDPEALSQRMCPESYVSFEGGLAKCLVVGSVPRYRVDAIKIGRSRLYRNDECTVEHFGVTPSVFGGFMQDGLVKRALPEKAFLDCLYFHMRGRQLLFDLHEDLNMRILSRSKIEDHLALFGNKKFHVYVKRVLNDLY